MIIQVNHAHTSTKGMRAANTPAEAAMPFPPLKPSQGV